MTLNRPPAMGAGAPPSDITLARLRQLLQAAELRLWDAERSGDNERIANARGVIQSLTQRIQKMT